jgi:hypothetical protein
VSHLLDDLMHLLERVVEDPQRAVGELPFPTGGGVAG